MRKFAGVRAHDLGEPAPEHAGRLGRLGPRPLHRDGEGPEVRQLEVAQDEAAVRLRVGRHPALALGRHRCELGEKCPLFVEQLLRAVAAQPVLELAQVLRVRPHLGQGHLVRAPRPLDR